MFLASEKNPIECEQLPINLRHLIGVILASVLASRKRRHDLRSWPHEDSKSKLRTLHRLCHRFSFLARLFHKYERHNDVVQNVHSRWLNFDSRLLFVNKVVRAMEFGNHRLLLIGGDQLRPVVQRLGELVSRRTRSPCQGSSPSHPAPTCTERHPVQ